MLRCRSRYSNGHLVVHPGELLRDLDVEAEALLLRDSPGSWEVVDDGQGEEEGREAEAEEGEAKGLDAPPVHRMMEREQVRRKRTERGAGPVMSRADHPGLIRPRG